MNANASIRANGELNIAIGANVHATRRRLGLSQQDLAKRAGLSVRDLQRCEKGQSAIAVETLIALADALGVEGGQLLADVMAQGALGAGAPAAASKDELSQAIGRLSPEGRRVLAHVASALLADPALCKPRPR